MKILETTRLALREVETSDAAFMLDLLNQPSWIKYIGDRGVRTLEESAEFIETRYRKGYKENGFGLWVVELKSNSDTLTDARVSASVPIGICGLVKRDTLPDPDIGFAFLPDYWGKGYAVEAADATIKYATENLGLNNLLAITTLDNESSIKLLEKTGFVFEKIMVSETGEELRLFSRKN